VRIRIIFTLENKGATVPFHHQFLIHQLIRSLIEKTEYSNYDLYNFSGLKGQIKASKDGISFYSAKVTLVISSLNEKFLQLLSTLIFNESEILIGKLVLKPLNIENELPVVLGNEVRYICISPMALLDPNDSDHKRFINPMGDAFSDALYDSTVTRIENTSSIGQIADLHKFQIVPDKEYLSKIHKEGKKFSRIFPVIDNEKMIEVRGYIFPFTLYAAPNVQQFVYDCGIGIFTNYGFGMLDIMK
jgi:CRISPR-associated endoribonuclease Cas6